MDEIVAVEKSLGITFPDAPRHLLLCHDGQQFYDPANGYGDPLIPMLIQPANGQGYSHYWLAGVQDIVECTRCVRDDHEWLLVDRFETFGPVRYHDRFINFTRTENADSLVLDMLPETGGVIGQVVLFCTQAPQLIVLAPDLETFLNTIAAGYKRGRFQHSPCEYSRPTTFRSTNNVAAWKRMGGKKPRP